MDRQEALKLLQLLPDADKETITKRYNTIFKKYRDKSADETGVPLSQYEMAYNVLLGITYVDPQEELRKQKQQARPNPLLKWLKIDPDKARNLIYYYKWKVVLIILALMLFSWIVYEQVNRVDPDLSMLIVGAVGLSDQEVFEQSIKTAVPTVTALQLQQIFLGIPGGDRQMEMAMEQKLQLEMIAGLNDFVVMDLTYYRILANFEYFKPLDERLMEFGTTAEAQADLVVELKDNGVPTGEKHIYGINVTDSKFFAGQLNAQTLVAAFPVNGKFIENAEALMKELMMK